jgi:acetolactate synthase-1/2/3 large subunit
MKKINGGHLTAKYLKEVENVDVVFTLSGGHIENILDGLTQYQIKAIDVRHEQTAAMMAHAWTVYRNEPGVCLVTAGPGFTNALTGIVNAHLENVPLVVICGRHPIADDLKGALQEMNQIDMVKPVTKWCATCFDIKRIPEYLSIAFRQAVTGRPGPVFLELPPDILFADIHEKDVKIPEKRHHKTRTQPEKSELLAAAEIINAAERPLFLGGSGVGMSNCKGILKEFIEKSGVPISLINYGQGMLSDNHPQSVNEGGFTGLNAALPVVDVIIAAGIRFNWVMQYGQLFPDAKVIRIDIDAYEVDRNRHADIGLVGDVGQILKKLLPMIEKRDHNEWLTSYKNAYSAFMTTELEIRQKPSDPIHPVRLVQQVMNVFGDDAYYIGDGGDTSYYALSGFSSAHKAGVVVPASGLLGCLGTGIPFALSAKLANPDKAVILLQGDGSFGFNGLEFDTAIRHHIPIICIINNDCAWGMIKHSQEMSIGKDRCTCTELGMRHYEKVVEGLGGYGEFVTRDEDIIPAIQRAIDSGKPACINVVTDPSVTSPATVLFYQNFSAL